MMQRLSHFKHTIRIVFKPNHDDSHLVLDRIIQQSKIAMNGGFFLEKELLVVGCVRAFGKYFPEERSQFERKGIADIDKIRAHVVVMDNQVQMAREANERERGTWYVAHPCANPVVNEAFAVVNKTNTQPCCHCGDEHHAGPDCHSKYGCPEDILARFRAERQGGSCSGNRNTYSGRGGGTVAHQAHMAVSIGGEGKGDRDGEDENGRERDAGVGGDFGTGEKTQPGTTLPDQLHVAIEVLRRNLDGYFDLFRSTIYPGEEEDTGGENQRKLNSYIPSGEDQTSVDWICHVQDETDKTPVVKYHIDSRSSVHI